MCSRERFSFGVDTLSGGYESAIIVILNDNMIRVVDGSDKEYLYSAKNITS